MFIYSRHVTSFFNVWISFMVFPLQYLYFLNFFLDKIRESNDILLLTIEYYFYSRL